MVGCGTVHHQCCVPSGNADGRGDLSRWTGCGAAAL